jgi:mannose-1-phosphate guanylyltransferase
VIILAGGAGTRLWPLSTDDNPKQFLTIFEGRSLLQRTFSRLSAITSSVYISTNERYASKVREQLPEIPAENILLEPERRNTAPAIAACCAAIAARQPDVTIGIFPSDHAIGNEPEFREVILRAFDFAEAADYLLTIGISPTEPSTGFGYLELSDELAPEVRRVRRFVEKPDHRRAEEFLAKGNFVWNGGMFVWRQEVFRRALERSAPEIAALASSPERYGEMPSISIDYAVMEKAERVACVPGEFEWSDVGSWSAVARISGGSAAFTEGARDVFALTDGSRAVAVVGLDNVGVIESPDGLLVINLERAELLSNLVKRLP